MPRPANLAVVFVLLAAVWTGTAQADLVGAPAEPPPLSAREREVLADNPDLAAIADVAPWQVRNALSRLSRGARDTGGADWREGTGPEDLRIFGRNPALQVIHQASPEAAAELLALIRTVAEGGGRRGME